MRDFPHVELELRATTHRVDMLGDGIDVAVRIGEISDANLIARKISSDRLVVVASPQFLAEHGAPGNLADLKNWIALPDLATAGRRPDPGR